jgi:5-(aminomethyl)-3-furanmethanol phosphate kinase
MKTILFKLGGSLLDWAEFPCRVLALAEAHREFRRAIVVGGGGGADWIRKIDQVHRLGDEVAHNLAVETMGVNARIVARVLGNAQLATSLDEIQSAWSNDRTAIIAPERILSNESDLCLPGVVKDWSTTSDSIAAWFAEFLRADELVLIKSTDVLDADKLERAAEQGLVDSAFPVAAKRLKQVSICDLRARTPLKRLLWSIPARCESSDRT